MRSSIAVRQLNMFGSSSFTTKILLLRFFFTLDALKMFQKAFGVSQFSCKLVIVFSVGNFSFIRNIWNCSQRKMRNHKRFSSPFKFRSVCIIEMLTTSRSKYSSNINNQRHRNCAKFLLSNETEWFEALFHLYVVLVLGTKIRSYHYKMMWKYNAFI